MKVLVINAGSSSLKYQLLDTESGEVMAKGLCERIGIDGVLTHTGNKSDEKFKFDIAMPTHKEAIQSVINILHDSLQMYNPFFEVFTLQTAVISLKGAPS